MLLGALLGTSTVASFLFIGRRSIRFDEAASVMLAISPWSRFLDVVTSTEINQAPYYLLLRPWAPVSLDEGWLRAPAAVMAIATVAVLWALTSRLFGRREAVIACLALALGGLYLREAQEVRGYAMAVFLATLSTYLFVLAITRATAPRWAAYVLVTALAIHTHFFAAFVVVAHVASLPFLPSPPRRHLISAFGALALVLTPLAIAVTTGYSGQTGHLGTPGLRDLAGALVRLVAGFEPWPGRLAIAIAFAAAGALAVGAAIASWRAAKRSLETWRFAVIFAWAATPFALAFAIAQAKSIFHFVYLVIALPAFAVIAAVGVMRIRSSRLRALAAMALIVAVAQSGIWYLVRYRGPQDWRSATAHVLSSTVPGDGVVVFAPDQMAGMQHYVTLRNAEDRAPEPVSPPDPWGTFTDITFYPAHPGLAAELTSLGRYPRIWLVLTHQSKTRAYRREVALIRGRLGEQHRLVDERVFEGIRVQLFEASRVSASP
jgi:mannosyltransferase